MDEEHIRKELGQKVDEAMLAAEKKAKKEFSKENQDPWKLTEEKITDEFTKNTSERVFTGMKKSDRMTRILWEMLRKKYLAACLETRFEAIKGDTDEKERRLYSAYAKRSSEYLKLITEMLENRTLEANTGYDPKMAGYRQLEKRRKALDNELRELEKRIIIEDALKEAKNREEMERIIEDGKYN